MFWRTLFTLPSVLFVIFYQKFFLWTKEPGKSERLACVYLVDRKTLCFHYFPLALGARKLKARLVAFICFVEPDGGYIVQ